jgi:hypothetical protein
MLGVLSVAAILLFQSAGEYWDRTCNPVKSLLQTKREWLVLIVGAGFLVRLFFSAFGSIYPDEYSVLQVLATRPLNHPVEFLVNYEQFSGVQWVHPPLAFLLMSIGYSVWPTVYGARLIVLAISTISIVVAYCLVKELRSADLAVVACAVYALLPQAVVLLTPATTDSFAHIFGVSSVLVYLMALNRESKRVAVVSGVLLGLSFLSKLGVPAAWAIGILLIALAYGKRLPYLGLAYGACAATCVPWVLLKPGVATGPTFAFIAQTVTSLLTPSIGPMAFLEKLRYASPTYVSMTELLVQMAFLLTPLLILLSAAGVLHSLLQRSRGGCSLAVWLILPLIAAIPKIRDIRYLLPMVIPFVYFTSMGLSVGSPAVRRRLKCLAVSFTLVFLGISFVVAQQQYAGPPEAVEILESLNLSDGSILSNFALQPLLPNARIVPLLPNTTGAQALQLVASYGVDAVAIMHHFRGAWPQPLPETVNALRPLFRAHITGGPANFSWYEIFYEKSYLASGSEEDTFTSLGTLSPRQPYQPDVPCSARRPQYGISNDESEAALERQMPGITGTFITVSTSEFTKNFLNSSLTTMIASAEDDSAR